MTGRNGFGISCWGTDSPLPPFSSPGLSETLQRHCTRLTGFSFCCCAPSTSLFTASAWPDTPRPTETPSPARPSLWAFTVTVNFKAWAALLVSQHCSALQPQRPIHCASCQTCPVLSNSWSSCYQLHARVGQAVTNLSTTTSRTKPSPTSSLADEGWASKMSDPAEMSRPVARHLLERRREARRWILAG